jgi:A/G-specific adenine glycosylase
MTDPVAVGCHDGEMTDPVAVGLRVVAWYRAGHRELPWRATGDPYRILVSEIMLQQTRVETVIGYYERFLQAFPDVAALAGASEEAVMALWQGLGYYSRARNLQKAARQILSRHGGAFPKEPGVLRQLAGIGPYTAGAIASIAFGVPEPAVDGNVLRVAARLGLVAEDILNAATRARITEMVRAMIPPAAAADFTQGMMELGATLCTPVNPACGRCPVRADCAALCPVVWIVCRSGLQRRRPRPQMKRFFSCVIRRNVCCWYIAMKDCCAGCGACPISSRRRRNGSVPIAGNAGDQAGCGERDHGIAGICGFLPACLHPSALADADLVGGFAGSK